jgi:hypothetical protein
MAKLGRHTAAGVMIVLMYDYVTIAALSWRVQMRLMMIASARLVHRSDEIQEAPKAIWKWSKWPNIRFPLRHRCGLEDLVDSLVAVGTPSARAWRKLYWERLHSSYILVCERKVA